MAKFEEGFIETATGISSEVFTLTIGSSKIKVYTHGAINAFHHAEKDVNAQRPEEIMLVHFVEMYK